MLDIRLLSGLGNAEFLRVCAALLQMQFPPYQIPLFPVPHVRLLDHATGNLACLLGTTDLRLGTLQRIQWRVRS